MKRDKKSHLKRCINNNIIVKEKSVKRDYLFLNILILQSIQFISLTCRLSSAGPVAASTLKYNNIKTLHNYLTKEEKAERRCKI